MKLPLLHYSNQKLKEVSKPFDFQNPSFDPIEFAQNLVETMHENEGICLAAIQVGIPTRAFALRGQPNLVCYNPRVINAFSDEIQLEETSLTYPGLLVKVKRPQHCKVRFAMPNGDIRTETYTGLTARCFLHSMEFLDGKRFYDTAGYIHRSQALKKWRAMKLDVHTSQDAQWILRAV